MSSTCPEPNVARATSGQHGLIQLCQAVGGRTLVVFTSTIAQAHIMNIGPVLARIRV
jgi:hypothetical protein